VLHTDETKLTQIVRNFASNALKFTERGEVRIGSRTDGGQIEFFVKDSGIGIAPEDQERIFEEFAQVEHKAQRRVKGTGLGLPLSRKLAELLGGTIRVESELGKGAIFFVRVPVKWKAPRAAEGEAVLAAVDDGPLLASWEQFLEGTRFRLVPARSLDEVREAVRRERPSVILAGPFLGGVPTRPLLAELKKDPETRDVPVLGYARAEHEERLLALGTDTILHGLEERHQLLEAVSRALGGHHG
jgi:anti-sigma regulatory factor (Ser/Thr protein kinase)